MNLNREELEKKFRKFLLERYHFDGLEEEDVDSILTEEEWNMAIPSILLNWNEDVSYSIEEFLYCMADFVREEVGDDKISIIAEGRYDSESTLVMYHSTLSVVLYEWWGKTWHFNKDAILDLLQEMLETVEKNLKIAKEGRWYSKIAAENIF